MIALVIKSPFIERILDGEKTWEIRGSRNNIRGPIGLIRSGSGLIFGVCEVIACLGPLTGNQFRRNARKAGMKQNEAVLGYYTKTFAWVLARPRRFNAPVSYKHPTGAVIWVKLDTPTECTVQSADSGTKARPVLHHLGRV